MISAPSLPFLGFAAVAIVAHNLAPGRWRARIVLPLANACFLFLVMPNWQALSLLAGFIIFSYASIWIAAKRNHLAFVCALISVLGYFAWAKGYPLLASLSLVSCLPIVIGLSYILIRSLQVVIDVYEGALPCPPSPWRFLNFICAWPMLLSGPIQSYQSFTRQLDSLQEVRLNDDIVCRSFARIAWGLFSVIVLADQAFGVHLQTHEVAVRSYANLSLPILLDLPKTFVDHNSILRLLFVPKVFGQWMVGKGSTPVVMLAVTQIAYLVYLYFNFSGYTHIVIGVGRLAGLDIPENFNRPWASRSFLDIWTRWHMTLANWFKAYVFNTIMHKLLRSWPAQAFAPYYAVAAFFVTFFLVGVWHGTTLPYLLCGFGLGFGASINKLWQVQLRKALKKKTNSRLSSSTIYQALCGSLALAYLSITITPFWASKDEIVKMSFCYGVFGQTLALFVTTILIIPASTICQAIERRAAQIDSFMINPYFVGLTLVATVIYVFLTPEVDIRAVYQGF